MINPQNKIVKTDEFLSQLRQAGCSTSVIETANAPMRLLENYCRDHALERVTKGICLDCASQRAGFKVASFKGTGNATLNRYLRVLRMYLTYVETGSIESAPLKKRNVREVTVEKGREFMLELKRSGYSDSRLEKFLHPLQRLSAYCREESIREISEAACLGCVSRLFHLELTEFRGTGNPRANTMLHAFQMYLRYLETGSVERISLTRTDPLKCSHPLKCANEFLAALSEFGYRESTLATYRNPLQRLARYCAANGIRSVTRSVCLRCASEYYHRAIPSFKGYGDQNVNAMLHAYAMFLHFLQHGEIAILNLRHLNAPACPAGFASVYESFEAFMRDQHFAEATLSNYHRVVLPLLESFAKSGIDDIRDVGISDILDYYKSRGHLGDHAKCGALGLYRRFFEFAYREEFIDEDIAAKIPHFRRVSDKRIPYAWRRETVVSLLQAMGRTTPTEKRDYAIVLSVARLGLRQHDIATLRMSSLDFDNDRISLVMHKTGKPLSLPLTRDVGWAILDYLRHGRPNIDSDYVFIKHKAPFGPMPTLSGLSHVLKLAKTKAGIDAPVDVRCGLHSLRSTLARRLLEEETPLPVISGVLGHSAYASTTPYLKIDISGLAKCALDPEEVTR